MKPIETFMFCFATASFFYWIPYFFNNCDNVGVNTIAGEKEDLDYIGWCGHKIAPNGDVIQ